MENEFVKMLEPKNKKNMQVIIKYPDKLQVIAEGDTELCSCIARTTFYYIGVKDWDDKKQKNDYKEIKDTPLDLKEKLDNSPLAEKYHLWSSDEEKLLVENYKSLGLDKILKNNLFPGLSRKKIISKVYLMGLGRE